MSSSNTKKSSAVARFCGCCMSEEDEEPQLRPPWSRPTNPNALGNQYQWVKQRCLRSNTLFEDPEFPSDNTMLYKQGGNDRNVRWLRPKEISPKPVYFHLGRDYYDMDQGELGDCWFIATVVCLAASPHKEMLSKVVPVDQGFEDNEYCGAFRFFFWRAGELIEVVIDDRLPTRHGRLIYSSNRENPEEYWSPLLEKAYAKFKGSYAALSGGKVTTSLQDLLGGFGVLVEVIRTKTSGEMLADYLLKLQTMNSILTVGIDKKHGDELALLKLRKLGAYHIYSILTVKKVKGTRGKTTLLHIRNPWGKDEWNGAWSDGSPEWLTLSEEDRQRTNRITNDGEFWICIDDFIQYFDWLCICHLTPYGTAATVADKLNKSQWKIAEHHGSWVYGITAGGPPLKITPTNNFWTNPQYELSLSRNSRRTTVEISLIEVESLREKRAPDIAFSFAVFEFKRGVKAQRVTPINYSQLISDYILITTKRSYREETAKYVLNPVDHIIVPNTDSYGQEAAFYLRICSEDEFISRPIGLPGSIDEGIVYASPLTAMDTRDHTTDREYDANAGSDGVNDANDFYMICCAGHEATGQPPGICNFETCRSLMFLADIPQPNGALNKESVIKVWFNLQNWQDAFSEYDIDNSKTIHVSDLPKVYQRLDIHIGEASMRIVQKRYAGKDNRITEDTFLQSVSRILQIYRMYQKLTFEGKLSMPVEEWMAVGLEI